MGMNKPDIHPDLQLRRTAGVFDHFNSYTDTQLWTKGGISGTVANSDGVGGHLTLTTGAVQSQTAFVWTTRKNWQFLAGQPLIAQTVLSYTEANTSQAGIFFGFTSAMTGILTAVTGVPLNPCSACGIFKKPGDILWSAFTSVGATQLITQSINSCILPGQPQELIVQVMLTQGNILEATFWAGGVGPTTITGGGPPGQTAMLPNSTSMSRMQPIKHSMSITGAVAMGFGVNVLAGSGSSEVVDVDYLASEILALP